MKISNKLFVWSVILSILLLVSLAVWSIKNRVDASSSSDSVTTSEQQAGKAPCRVVSETEGGNMDELTRMRDIYGYPTGTPLTEAVRIFNQETQCKGAYAEYAPLTEDELIAAIVAGADYGKQGEIWRAQRETLWHIASQRMMPKGSLLVVESGGRVQESPLRPEGTIQAKGIRITLLLGLDQTNEGILKAPKPEQTLLIRKTYYQVETVR